MEEIAYLLLTPFDLLLQLLKWALTAAALGITIYATWFFLSTPIKYLWIGIKKLFAKDKKPTVTEETKEEVKTETKPEAKSESIHILVSDIGEQRKEYGNYNYHSHIPPAEHEYSDFEKMVLEEMKKQGRA